MFVFSVCRSGHGLQQAEEGSPRFLKSHICRTKGTKLGWSAARPRFGLCLETCGDAEAKPAQWFIFNFFIASRWLFFHCQSLSIKRMSLFSSTQREALHLLWFYLLTCVFTGLDTESRLFLFAISQVCIVYLLAWCLGSLSVYSPALLLLFGFCFHLISPSSCRNPTAGDLCATLFLAAVQHLIWQGQTLVTSEQKAPSCGSLEAAEQC